MLGQTSNSLNHQRTYQNRNPATGGRARLITVHMSHAGMAAIRRRMSLFIASSKVGEGRVHVECQADQHEASQHAMVKTRGDF